MDDAQEPGAPFTGSRQYKSRRNRPCDLCRARKVACNIETQPPCTLCLSKGRSCTFVNGPGRRSRPQRPAHSPQPESVDHEDTDSTADQLHRQLPLDPTLEPAVQEFGHYALPTHVAYNGPYTDADMEGGYAMTMHQFAQPDTLSALQEATLPAFPYHQQASLPPPMVTHFNQSGYPQPVSLENRLGQSYRFVGPSGELDTYLLARRRYDNSLQSPSPFTSILYQQTMPLQSSLAHLQPPSVFTLGDVDLIRNTEPKFEVDSSDTLGQLRTRFGSLVNETFSYGLFRLYFRFVNPAFPVLSLSQTTTATGGISGLPLSLIAAVCAAALPFAIYDDALSVQQKNIPPAVDIMRIAWTALQLEWYDVRLPTIQAALLILQRQTKEELFGEATFNWRLCGMILASCETLGLNRNPDVFEVLPVWERKLRKRLWWAVVVSEVWTAFGQGMASHVDFDECDVPVPTPGDLLDHETDVDGAADNPRLHFLQLVSLTFILRDIRTAFFTVQAERRTANDLQGAAEAAKMLRVRLRKWQDDLPPSLQHNSHLIASSTSSTENLNSTGSIKLAYIIAQLSIFRALLRPLATAALTARTLPDQPSVWESEIAVAVVKGALSCVRELIKFVESLTASDWDGFWHSWSRHNFAIASTCLMHLLALTAPGHQSPPDGSSPHIPDVGLAAALHTTLTPSSENEEARSSNPLQNEHAELRTLTRKWRWALRLAERGAGGQKGLMSTSLRRVEALFTEWQIGRETASNGPQLTDAR